LKNLPQIAGGVLGAAVGFAAVLLILVLTNFGNRADPITSGLLALFVLAPAGAIAGLVLGTKLAMRMRGGENTGGLVGNSLKAFGALIAVCAIAGTAYYAYAVSTATPWLNPNAANPLLVFEVRLPAGSALPNSASEVAVELQTDINTMPGEPKFKLFRRDNDRAVITGDVELAFRTAHRQLEITIKGQPARVYRIGLTARAPHASQLGPWQPNADGSEIRYRAQWPGRE
jgi:hypothetical protein